MVTSDAKYTHNKPYAMNYDTMGRFKPKEIVV